MVGPKPPGRDAGALSSSDTEGHGGRLRRFSRRSFRPRWPAERSQSPSRRIGTSTRQVIPSRSPSSSKPVTAVGRDSDSEPTTLGWSVDGELEATDERRFVADRPSAFSFDRGERKRAQITWNGRFERTRGRHESIVPEPGEYEIRAFVTTHEGATSPPLRRRSNSSETVYCPSVPAQPRSGLRVRRSIGPGIRMRPVRGRRIATLTYGRSYYPVDGYLLERS